VSLETVALDPCQQIRLAKYNVIIDASNSKPEPEPWPALTIALPVSVATAPVTTRYSSKEEQLSSLFKSCLKVYAHNMPVSDVHKKKEQIQ